MSTQRLATELMQHIVDMLGEGPRDECLPALLACSTANSALLNTSQKHIFRTVVLYSHSASTTHWFIAPAADIQAQCDRTRRFLRSMPRNPRLCSYVKDLACRFNDGSFCDNSFIHTIIRYLPNVVQFAIGIYNQPNNRAAVGLQMEQDAFNGMVTLLRQPQLKILSLEAFSGFPLEALLLAPGLETFVLHSCGHSLQDADYDLPAHSSSFVPRLKTLICDRTSLANVVNFCLVQRPSRSCLALISGLQKIDLTVLSGDISTDIYGPLLQQARNLNHFGLTVKGSTLNSPSHITLGGISPLQNLNSSSFSTLAHISLNISTASYPHPQTQRSEFTIRDPFLGICGSPLSNLRALKTFDVDLTVQGDFNFETFDFGSQWGVLSETLAVPTAYPKLRKVVISIGIKAIGARDSHTAINSNNPAENLLSRYFDYVVKPQFRALKVLHWQGVLDFSFLVKVWDGRQFVQVQK